MNFFAHQEQARRRTGQLILYYGLAVAMIIVVIYLVLGFAFGSFYDEETQAVATLWLPELFLLTAVAVTAVIGLGTLYQVYALSSGGAAVAEMLGGRLVPAATRDPLERRFLNVVEEMALASGVPMPRAYVLDDEGGINAFAAGHNTTDAVVAVTRGCLETLNRDELQGVVAHEFSHILNGDMKLNLRLIGVLYGILLVSIIGYMMFRMAGVFGGGRRSSSRDNKNGGGAAALAIMLAGLGIWLIGYIGVFFANLIKSAVSREREYLADASAVQFTRNPDGLGGALKKIGARTTGSRVTSTRAAEASHLFFAEGVGHAWLNLLATHPPLIDRIRRLDPNFDGKFDRIRLNPEAPAEATTRPSPTRARPIQAAGLAGASAAAATAQVPMESLSQQVGTQGSEYLEFVQQFIEILPPDLRDASRSPREARAVAFALLLSADPKTRRQQLELLQSRCGQPCREKAESLLPLILQVPRSGYLPLGDLAMGTLRQMAADEYETFRSTAMALAAADEQIDLFEYAFLRMMVRRLDSAFGKGRKPGALITRLADARGECLVLLGGLAYYGQPEAGARKAFQIGAGKLFGQAVEMPAAAACTLKQVDEALARLADLRPTLKEAVLDACGLCAGHDGQVTVEEADLLRAVADALDCPVPPLSLKNSG
jgi:Zn-dependent protease with chaperone function